MGKIIGKLEKLVNYLVDVNQTAFGMLLESNETSYVIPVFDEPGSYEYAECKSYNTLDSFSISKKESKNDMFKDIDMSTPERFKVTLLKSIVEALDNGKCISFYVTRLTLSSMESAVSCLPIEFYVSAIANKVNNRYIVEYTLEDDNNYILVIDKDHQKLIEELVEIQYKRYLTIEKHARKK